MSYTPAPTDATVIGLGPAPQPVVPLLLTLQSEAETLAGQVAGVGVTEWQPPQGAAGSPAVTVNYPADEQRRIWQVVMHDGSTIIAGFLMNARGGLFSSGSWDLTQPNNPKWVPAPPTPAAAPAGNPAAGGPADWTTIENAGSNKLLQQIAADTAAIRAALKV